MRDERETNWGCFGFMVGVVLFWVIVALIIFL